MIYSRLKLESTKLRTISSDKTERKREKKKEQKNVDRSLLIWCDELWRDDLLKNLVNWIFVTVEGYLWEKYL